MTPRKLNRRDMLRVAGIAGGVALTTGGTSRVLGAPLVGGKTGHISAYQEVPEAKLQFYFGANTVEAETRNKVIEAFNQKFPQITIEPLPAPAGQDAIQNLQVMIAGGSAPDITMSWELSYAGLADRQTFADLNEYIAADPDYPAIVQNDHEQQFLDMFGYGDKQFVLPEQFTDVVLYYNKKHFEEAGLTPPPADWTDATWTWDKFLETAQALTKKDGSRVSQFGFVDAWWPALSSMVIGTGNGGNWFDTYVNPTKATITDPNILAGLQWYADLINVHNVAPNAEQSQTQGGVDVFLAGRASMTLTGHWMYPAMAQLSADGALDFDIGILPVGPSGTTAKTDLGGTGLSILASTEYGQQAWEFVKFSTSPEGQAVIASSGLFVPVLKTQSVQDAFAGAHGEVQNFGVFTSGLQNAVPLPISAKWGELSAAWARETDKVLQGQAQAADVYPALETELNGILGA
jgi:multiple sugar transport system substrate-binding protein